MTERPDLAALGADTRREQLVALAQRLTGDELAVLALIARRLDAGRQRYGALDVSRDGRDFRVEALEELADAAVYLAAAILRGGPPGNTPQKAHRPRRKRTPAAGRVAGMAAGGEGGAAPRCASTLRRCSFCASELVGRRADCRYCDARCRAAASDLRRGRISSETVADRQRFPSALANAERQGQSPDRDGS